MSTTKNLRLAKFLKGLLDFLLGAIVFACSALILWIALSPLVLSNSWGLGTVAVPIAIGRENDSQIGVSFASLPEDVRFEVSIIEAEGMLRLETSNFSMILIANAAKVIGGIGLAYVFYLLRRIVKTIVEGNPFSAENSRHIRQLGYAVLLVGILWQAVHYFAAAEILRRLPDINPTLYPGPTFDPALILVSLLVLLLSHVWSYGLELERDRELTI